MDKADVQFASEKNMREINTIHERQNRQNTVAKIWQIIKQRSNDKLTSVFVELLETSRASQNPNDNQMRQKVSQRLGGG